METFVAPDPSSAVAPQNGTGPALPPPLPTSIVPPGGVLYKVDSSRASFAELWRDARPSTVWLAWLSKLLRTRLPGSVNDPNVESLHPFAIDESVLPASVRAQFEPVLRDLNFLGFDSGASICHMIIDLYNNNRTYLISMPRPDGRAVARVVLRNEGSGLRPKTHFHCELLTALNDGGFVWSTGGKAVLAAPEPIRINRRVGASAAELWAFHEQQLANLPTGAGVRPALGKAGAEELLERHHLQVRDFHLRRGLFSLMTDSDRQAAGAIERAYTQGAADGQTFPDIMAEIERLQHRKSSWFGGAVVLAISLLAFLALGVGNGTGAFTSRQTRELLMLLVPVLFFHELGHYLAMRIFHYRNVRMFFIPLFGAAVSGTHYSAPGWKKIIVALMGPLPGIVVGAVLGIVGVAMHQPLLIKIALMALILNGANLLPILPLDGGRVVQTLLFARTFAADIAFRLLAAIALIVIGVIGGGKIYLFLGIFMTVGLPLLWRRGRIVADLRREGLVPPPSDDQRIPAGLARIIIARVTTGTTRRVKQSNRTIAQSTLAIYEALCNRPPGWAATIGFGALQFGAILFAIAFALVLGVAQGGQFAQFARAAAARPKHSISPADIVVTGHEPLDERRTIVANFAKPARAIAAYETLAPSLAPGEAVERFGQTVFVAFPANDDAARRRHVADIERLTQDFSVESAKRYRAYFRFSCLAPNETAAQQLEDEIQEYTRAPAALDLIAPWSPEASQSRDWAARRLARRTYLRIQRARHGINADPTQNEVAARMQRAIRAGDTAESDRLAAELRNQRARQRRDELQQLRNTTDGSIDLALLEKCLALPSPDDATDTDQRAEFVPPDFSSPTYQEIAQRMGQLPHSGGKPMPGVVRFSASGSITREGLLLSLQFWTFQDDIAGAPALLNWLAARGCKSMHYECTNPMASRDE